MTIFISAKSLKVFQRLSQSYYRRKLANTGTVRMTRVNINQNTRMLLISTNTNIVTRHINVTYVITSLQQHITLSNIDKHAKGRNGSKIMSNQFEDHRLKMRNIGTVHMTRVNINH